MVLSWRFRCPDGERDGEPLAVRGDVEASEACQTACPRARLVSDERLALYCVADHHHDAATRIEAVDERRRRTHGPQSVRVSVRWKARFSSGCGSSYRDLPRRILVFDRRARVRFVTTPVPSPGSKPGLARGSLPLPSRRAARTLPICPIHPSDRQPIVHLVKKSLQRQLTDWSAMAPAVRPSSCRRLRRRRRTTTAAVQRTD